MKRLYTLATAMGTAVLATAQITGLSVETVTEHDGVAIPELAGHTTYRVYADVTSSTDFISAVYGDQDSPLMLDTDGTFFQETIQGIDLNFGQHVSPFLFDFVPASEYDSWVTIGISNSTEGSAVQNTPSTLADAFNAFNAGEGFVVNDPIGGSWFNLLQCITDLETCANEDLAFGGADNRVLIAQLTSTGDVYGVFNMQVFPAGNQDEEIKQTLTFSSDASDVFGCTNPAPRATRRRRHVRRDRDHRRLLLRASLHRGFVRVQLHGPSCHGDADASIAVEAMGAQGADYFYLDSIGSQQGLNFGNFGNLLAGTYTALRGGCRGLPRQCGSVVPVTEPIEVTVELTAPVFAGEEDAELSVASATGGTGDFTTSCPLTQKTPPWRPHGLGWRLVKPCRFGPQTATDASSSRATASPSQAHAHQRELVHVGHRHLGRHLRGHRRRRHFLGGSRWKRPSHHRILGGRHELQPSPVTVSGGTYTVIAQDVYGCQGTMSESVVWACGH